MQQCVSFSAGSLGFAKTFTVLDASLLLRVPHPSLQGAPCSGTLCGELGETGCANL